MHVDAVGITPRALRYVPAGLSAIRLLAVPSIVGRALQGARSQCCAAIAGSVMINLADGILARRIGQSAQPRQQRRLDGAADAVFVVAVPLCAYRLRPELLREERAAITLLGLCQTASLLACYARFRRLPRYHTAGYKWSAGTLGVALAGRVAGGWLSLGFRPAMAAVAVAHLEALAISLLLDAYRTPVPSLRAVMQAHDTRGLRRRGARDPRVPAYAVDG